jgi:hypothetical protein
MAGRYLTSSRRSRPGPSSIAFYSTVVRLGPSTKRRGSSKEAARQSACDQRQVRPTTQPTSITRSHHNCANLLNSYVNWRNGDAPSLKPLISKHDPQSPLRNPWCGDALGRFAGWSFAMTVSTWAHLSGTSQALRARQVIDIAYMFVGLARVRPWHHSGIRPRSPTFNVLNNDQA